MATVLAFHAHPDDEALLTGGTLARLADEGHRVVLVIATDGLMGAVPTGGEPPRLRELRTVAALLGVDRVVHLGYADSGHGALLCPDPPDRTRFVRADTEEAAERLAAILREEDAAMLLSYEANGGYGHRDHVKVHQVGRRAAELAETARALEATMPRDAAERLVRLVRLLRIPLRFGPEELAGRFSPRTAITRRIDVRRYARQKQAALAAHHSQVKGTGRVNAVLQTMVRLPVPVFGLLFGREWFIDVRPGRSAQP
ncbi:PIG-L family deacetylase [Streptomyces sp. NPDC005271]|uniref:PIG-L deacetylase family protein n=1 Tax=unclassified Streptomyces TaxID=2593676 RepID=UPI00339E592D